MENILVERNKVACRSFGLVTLTLLPSDENGDKGDHRPLKDMTERSPLSSFDRVWVLQQRLFCCNFISFVRPILHVQNSQFLKIK